MNSQSSVLFRSKAVEYHRNQWLGKAMLISKIPAWLIVLMASIFFVVFTLFVGFGEYTRRLNVDGETISFPHPIDIFVPQNGYVTNVFANVGDEVKQGDSLYQLNVDRITESGDVSTKKISVIREKIKQTDQIIEKLKDNKAETISNLKQQIEYNNDVVAKTEEILKDIKEGVEFIQRNIKDYDKYKEMGLINKDQQNNQRYTFYQHQSTYQNLHSQHMNNMLQISNLKSDLLLKSSDFDNKISEYQLQREDLLRQLVEAEADGHIVVTAPLSGRIESLSVTIGQMVIQGDSLVQLKPLAKDSQLYIVLWIPNEAIPYVRKGDKMNIRYDAFPFEKFGQFLGEVESISSVPVSMKELSNYQSSPINKGNQSKVAAYYKSIIRLRDTKIIYDNEALVLISGMKAQATLFLETRPIYQWMLAPFYDVKRSVTGVVK